MAFGVSGNDKKSQMIGGDVTVAWMDHSTGFSCFMTCTLLTGGGAGGTCLKIAVQPPNTPAELVAHKCSPCVLCC